MAEAGDKGSTLQQPGATESPLQTGAPADLGDLVGRRILQFRVLARLGEGGMGVVYRARDERLRRDVALKVLAARYLADDRNKELIFREARSAAAVTHAHVAAIYDVQEADGIAFLAMEYVEGETLRARLARGSLPLDEALAIADDVARGLARAHELGVVHRDLKPDNIMLTVDGRVKLLDFGLAKVVYEGDPGASTATASAASTALPAAATRPAMSPETRAGRVMGTPAYMAPEQARGDIVDARADVFAFGATIYELVTGAPPFAHRGASPPDWVDADWVYAPLGKDVPRPVAELVSRCLELEPSRRFANAGELVAALRDLAPVRSLSDSFGRSRALRSVVSRPRRRAWPFVGIALVVVGSGAGAVAVLGSRGGDDAPAIIAPPSCDAVPTLDARWNDAIRARTKAHLTGPFAADDLAAYDDFVARWRALHHTACATETTEPTRELGGKQLACLDGALDQFSAQLVRPAYVLPPVHEVRPALPDSTRCLGNQPGAPVTTHVLAKTFSEISDAVLSPDGTRYAMVVDDRLAVTSVESAIDELTIRVPAGSSLESWVGDRITLWSLQGLTFVDVVRRTVEAGPKPSDMAIAVSHDATRSLDIDDKGDVRVVDLLDGSRSLPVANIKRDALYGFAMWSPGDQAMVGYYDGGEKWFAIIDTATGHSSRLPYRLDPSNRSESVVWRDDHTLLFTGRSDLDHGDGVWSATFRHGELDGPVTEVLTTERDTVFGLQRAAHGRVTANRVAVHHDLARIHDGRAARITNAPSVRWIGATDGERVSVVRETGSGIVSLADGNYVPLADHMVWAAFDGDRLVETDGDALIVADAASGTKLRTIPHPLHLGLLRGGAVSCARDVPGRCIVLLREPIPDSPLEQYWIATLDGDTLGTPINAGRPYGFRGALSPDGRRIALFGITTGWIADQLDILDLATGHHEKWPIPKAGCSKSPEYLAWSPTADTILYTQQCGDMHLYRVAHGKPPTDLFSVPGWISGLAVARDGTPIVGLREYTSTGVVLDGL